MTLPLTLLTALILPGKDATLEFQVLLGIHFSIFQGIIGKKNSELSTNSLNVISKEMKVVTFLGNHKTS